MKKQTAVEWLFNRLNMDLNIYQKAEAFEQAKQMEKEQMIIFYKKGYKRNVSYDLTKKAAEIEYNKTYKQD